MIMRINRDRWKWEQKERERERERVVRMALCSGARSLPALFIRSLSLFAGPFARRVSFTCAKGTVAQLSAGDQSLAERAGQRPLPQPLKWLRERERERERPFVCIVSRKRIIIEPYC